MIGRPLDARMSLPCCTLVPSSRTTSGTLQVDLACCRDDALGDDVAAHDAAEDVDEDALHGRIAEDDLERRGDLLLRGAAADVEEIGGLAAFELDDVHRRHGEAGAVDHAADVAVELDVGEVVFRRLDLHRILFGEVAQRLEIRVTELGIVVEADLGIEHHQLTLIGHRQRIDLDLRRVRADEGLVKAAEHLPRLLGEIAGKAERRGHFAAVVRHQSGRRIDGDGADLLGRLVRDLLDVHAAFGRSDDGRRPVSRSTRIAR